MKIALINVRYSPNLGDGLLSECLETELRRHLPDASFVSIDLAGRTGYAAGSPWRRPLMNLLLAAPAPVRRFVSRRLLDRLTTRLAPVFAEKMAGCQVAVLGGGNLLADADLNFPLKIDCAVNACRSADGDPLPLAVYAVGVSNNWSDEGSAIFRRILGAPSVVSIAVRDQLSYDALRDQTGSNLGERPVGLVRDPGLLASRHFDTAPDTGPRAVGLCITAPVALRYHGGTGDDGTLANWFGELAGALANAGRNVILFTNGSPEDRHFLGQHAGRWCSADPSRIRVAQPAGDPKGLVGIIASCSLVIAHRMHACIAAHSFAIPTIGLQWDPKLDAFFELAGRGSYLFAAGVTPVAVVAAHAEKALAEGVDRQALDILMTEAVEDVATLARTLRAAIV